MKVTSKSHAAYGPSVANPWVEWLPSLRFQQKQGVPFYHNAPAGSDTYLVFYMMEWRGSSPVGKMSRASNWKLISILCQHQVYVEFCLLSYYCHHSMVLRQMVTVTIISLQCVSFLCCEINKTYGLATIAVWGA